MKKKIVYPKVDGKKFDHLRINKFDDFRESFAWAIKEVLEKRGNNLTKEQIKEISETAAWNCAYMVVTE